MRDRTSRKASGPKRAVRDALIKQKAIGIVLGRSISLGNIKNNFKKLLQNLEL